MKGTIVGATLILGALLSGCGTQANNKQPKQREPTTPLKVENISKGKIQSNKNGKYEVKMIAPKKATVEATYIMPNGAVGTEIPVHSLRNGHFVISEKISPKHKKIYISIGAYNKHSKDHNRNITVINNSYSSQNIQASKKMKGNSTATSKSLQSSKLQASKQNNKDPQKHGLSGLKYQADKYLKKDDSVAFYHPVKVLGYDDTKPYVANIEFKANNESKATMKDGAVSILEGVKKADYKDFSNIKISFTQNVSNANGKTLKNIPVLGYSFSRSTLESIDPNNMDSSDLSKVADSHFDKHVEDD